MTYVKIKVLIFSLFLWYYFKYLKRHQEDALCSRMNILINSTLK